MSEFLPLPTTTEALLQAVGRAPDRHAGLLLDKLGQFGGSPTEPERKQEDQKTILERVADLGGGDEALARGAAVRQALLAGTHALRWTATTLGPFTLHLSRATAHENAGICLHPVYGFVYLPGSGLKGAARAYAELAWLPQQPDAAEAWKTIQRIFGASPGSDYFRCWVNELTPIDPKTSQAGAVVFHDGWPSNGAPKLVVDILNSHHANYYQADERRGVPAPVDSEDPKPVYFLAVRAGSAFEFALSKRHGTGDADIALASEWVAQALHSFGAGAKTTSGYGTFSLPENVLPASLPATRYATFETTVELASPAFLAGAQQDETDCDLRPATLRGQLRWWWRTMHSGFVTPAVLRRMESLIWGDTTQQGAVRVEVGRAADAIPVPERFSRPSWQGLLYYSYGMAEGGRDQRSKIPAGARWKIRITAKHSAECPKGGSVGIPPDVSLAQAKAALELLCTFGGVGSKSRKGFGSLQAERAGDIDACNRAGNELRRVFGQGDDFDARRAESPALANCIGPLSFTTVEREPERLIDVIGIAMKEFVSPPVERDRRHTRQEAMGLPRKGFGGKNERHASPFLFHLVRGSEGALGFRWIAFPTPRLPNLEDSTGVLTKLKEHLESKRGEIEQPRPTHGGRGGERAGAGQRRDQGRGGRPRDASPRPEPPRTSAATLRNGATVRGRIGPPAEPGKTRKVTEILGTTPPRKGYIDKSCELPPDLGEGSDHDFFVWNVPASPRDELRLWFKTVEHPHPPGWTPPRPPPARDDRRGGGRGGPPGRGGAGGGRR